MIVRQVRSAKVVQFRGQDVGEVDDPETLLRYAQLELKFPGSDPVSKAQVDAVKAGA